MQYKDLLRQHCNWLSFWEFTQKDFHLDALGLAATQDEDYSQETPQYAAYVL